MIAPQRHMGGPFAMGPHGGGRHHGPEVPVGTVIAFAGQVAPPLPATASPPDSGPGVTGAGIQAELLGWMLCDGRTLVAGAYPELFQALGTLYGGSGGNFNLPDYRGYFLRGTDAGSGRDPDVGARTPPAGGATAAQVGSVQRDAVLTHYHDYQTAPAPTELASQGPAAAKGSDKTMSGGPVGKDDKPLTPATGGSDHETRPKNVYVNYLIKFTHWPMRPHGPTSPSGDWK